MRLAQNGGKIDLYVICFSYEIRVLEFNLQIFGNKSYINSYPFRSPVQSVEKILLSVMSMIAEPNINRYKIHIVQRIVQNVYNIKPKLL